MSSRACGAAHLPGAERAPGGPCLLAALPADTALPCRRAHLQHGQAAQEGTAQAARAEGQVASPRGAAGAGGGSTRTPDPSSDAVRGASRGVHLPGCSCPLCKACSRAAVNARPGACPSPLPTRRLRALARTPALSSSSACPRSRARRAGRWAAPRRPTLTRRPPPAAARSRGRGAAAAARWTRRRRSAGGRWAGHRGASGHARLGPTCVASSARSRAPVIARLGDGPPHLFAPWLLPMLLPSYAALPARAVVQGRALGGGGSGPGLRGRGLRLPRCPTRSVWIPLVPQVRRHDG